jgi:hypothetical protein
MLRVSITLGLAVLLQPLELDEAFDFALSVRREALVLGDQIRFLRTLFEELSDPEIERLQDLEKSVEADFVLALLHAGEIGLMDSDHLGKLHLRQLSLTAKLPDLPSDEFKLCRLVH